MNNVKLTLATTLSILTLAFSGAASADNGKRFENQKQKSVLVKTTYSKDRLVKNENRKQVRNQKNVKRVIVKTAPVKKVVVAKKKVRHPIKSYITTNKRFTQVKRLKNKRARQATYSVRAGDTLFQISYKTGVSVKQLARLNRIKNHNLNYLKVGQTLRLV